MKSEENKKTKKKLKDKIRKRGICIFGSFPLINVACFSNHPPQCKNRKCAQFKTSRALTCMKSAWRARLSSKFSLSSFEKLQP